MNRLKEIGIKACINGARRAGKLIGQEEKIHEGILKGLKQLTDLESEDEIYHLMKSFLSCNILNLDEQKVVVDLLIKKGRINQGNLERFSEIFHELDNYIESKRILLRPSETGAVETSTGNEVRQLLTGDKNQK